MTLWARAHLVIPDVAPSAPHSTRTRIDSGPPAAARARNLHGRLTHHAAFPLHEHSVRTQSREGGVTPGARAHGVLRPAPEPGCPATDTHGAGWWLLCMSARRAPVRPTWPLHDKVGPGPSCPVIDASWLVAPVVGYMPNSRRSPNCGGRPASTISRAVAAASYSVRRNSTRTGSPSSTSRTR